jgi:hypothetical protein
MCTVLLPPGVNPIAVNKHIIPYISELFHYKMVDTVLNILVTVTVAVTYFVFVISVEMLVKNPITNVQVC